jgi:hypothetical protein
VTTAPAICRQRGASPAAPGLVDCSAFNCCFRYRFDIAFVVIIIIIIIIITVLSL